MISLSNLAAEVGLDTSVLRRDIAGGRLKAKLIGRTYIVDDEDATHWKKNVAPEHIVNRRKPSKAASRAR